MGGKLIVFEGIDSSGKATQISLLQKRLVSLGYKVDVFDFPQYKKKYGKLIGDYLNGKLGDFKETDPYEVSKLYALDRESAADLIKNSLEVNDIVIVNRYVASNIAFQGAKIDDEKRKSEFKSWVENLEYNKNKLPKEDLVVFLDVPVEASSELVSDKDDRGYIEQGKKDIHEEDLGYQERVRDEYKKLAAERSWSVVSCAKGSEMVSIEEIEVKVFEALRKLLKI